MLDHIKKEFKKSKITFNKKLLIAVSGGIDSMVVWNLIHKSKRLYGVAHVNFSLRENASDLDEQLVLNTAKEKGVQCHSLKIDAKAYAKEKKLSIQMAAREIRYNFFQELKKEHLYDTIVTAHHLEDNIETFLLNLNRGTGLKGLTGIHSSSQLFRPLLTFSKDDIRAYAKTHEVAFRNDNSNNDTFYERNWFRHEIIARWKERNPQLLNIMKSNLSLLGQAHDIVEKQLKSELKELKKEQKKGFMTISKILRLNKPKFSLYRLLSEYNFKESQIKGLLKSLRNNQVGKLFISSSHVVSIDREKIFLNKKGQIREEKKIYWLLGDGEQLDEPIRINIRTLEKFMFSYSKSKNKEAFDKEKLSFPLKLRKWKKGDKMQPLGMKGKKKVSDILIDEKIPLAKKEDYFVLTSNEEIVWLVGLKPDERFKIEKKSKSIVQISI